MITFIMRFMLAQSNDENHVEEDGMRRSTRIRRAPTFLEDYRHQIMLSPFNKELKQNNKVHYPIESVISYNKLS